MKRLAEIETFNDPDYCNDDVVKLNKCPHLFRGQCWVFVVNLKHDFPDIGCYDRYQKCEKCKDTIKLEKKITTGKFSITEFEDDKVFIQRETGKDGGEGFGYSKDDFDKFIGEFFEKNM